MTAPQGDTFAVPYSAAATCAAENERIRAEATMPAA